MPNYSYCLLILLSLSITTAHAEEPDLPTPPAGFAWQWCEGVDVGILMPDQWHFKSHREDTTLGYFITQENIDKTGQFNTGLSLNVFPNVGQKNDALASDVAISYVRAAIQDKDSVLQIIQPSTVGTAKTFGCRIKKNGAIVHYFLVADDSRDVLYLFLFESLEDEWNEAWKTGEILLQNLYIAFPAEQQVGQACLPDASGLWAVSGRHA